MRGPPNESRLARALRRNQTDAERRLWHTLRGRRFAGYKFRRQQPIGPYIVDFVCLEHRLIIELDGAHHLDQRPEDESREVWLRAQDSRLLRFWDDEVLDSLEWVEQAVEDVLAPAHP